MTLISRTEEEENITIGEKIVCCTCSEVDKKLSSFEA